MKLSFKVSPNYHDNLSTQAIMFHLTLGLLIVFLASDIYYFVNYGADFGIRAIGLLISSIIASLLTEVVWCYFTKKPVKEYLLSSFPWVTAIILTLTCQVSISYYAIIISSIFAIFFGKLVFGGFGQNIFNPAGVGRAIIASSFTSSIVSDFVMGATPTAAFAAKGWFTTNLGFMAFIKQFGGLNNMFIGAYPGAMGETSALIIIIVAIYLTYKKVIDPIVPVIYISALFIVSLIIGIFNGQGLWYPIFHILTGGAFFGAVFMMTDPVTNPTSIPGRIMFALGCAFLTVLIRINANYPEGVLYSILIMNILTPAIEKIFDCGQIQNENKNLRILLITFICGILICLGITMYKIKSNEVAKNKSAVATALYR